MLLIDLINDDRYLWKFFVLAKSDEDCDLYNFLNSLSEKDFDAWNSLLAIMETMAEAPEGPRLSDSLSHEMGSSKYRIFRFEKGRLRIAWFYGAGNKVIICSHGYYKKSQKTPISEIKKAEKNYEAYCKMIEKKGK